jgi:hypothetical protein
MSHESPNSWYGTTPLPWKILWKHDTHKIKRDQDGRILGNVIVPFEDYYMAVQLVNANQKVVQALKVARTMIERLSTQHGPFNSSQGTLDVINEALREVREEHT